MARGRGPKLLTLVRRAIRLRHYSRHTEEAYVAWVRRFVRFAGLRHPASLGEAEVERFLSSLAELGVSATTQNQAASALRFLYEEVLGRPFARPAGVVHAKEPGRVPVVLTREEVRASCPGQGGSGCGSGCFPGRACTGMRRPGSGGAIICTRASCSGR